MNFTFFPVNTSRYQSEFDAVKINQILEENTLKGSLSSTAHHTNKTFIGTIERERFKIISSSNRTSMFCVFEGKILSENNQIVMITRLHPTFKNLFLFWFLAMISLLIFLPGKSNKIVTILMFICFVLFLRHLLITFIFKKSEAEGNKKLIQLLKMTAIQ